MKTRSAAALSVWIMVGSAALAGTLAFTAVQASRVGCVNHGTANLIAVGGIAGFGLAVATLLVVAGVPRYRGAAPALGAILALALSIYAVVAFLARDGGSCF
jgi:hypothetical protein